MQKKCSSFFVHIGQVLEYGDTGRLTLVAIEPDHVLLESVSEIDLVSYCYPEGGEGLENMGEYFF